MLGDGYANALSSARGTHARTRLNVYIVVGERSGLFRVLHLCSVTELSGALSENRRILYRQKEVQETLLSLFPIYGRLPKLNVSSATLQPTGRFVHRFLKDAKGRVAFSLPQENG